jgi:hypothetical protein
MDRNPISDLEAVAAMPGLEQLADVVARHVIRGKGSATDPMSILILLAGRWAFGSANTFDSAVQTTPLWEQLRTSAARVGRSLPERPPTFSQLCHLRKAADDGLMASLSVEFTKASVALAKEVGLLDPSNSPRWDRPAPSTVIYGDGSVFKPLSDVTFDEDGNVQGSRAKENPRVGPHFKGKHGNEMLMGLPITAVGVHGRKRWQRMILALDLFEDRNEIGSSMRLFERVISLANGGVTHVVYDRLASGTHLRQLMKWGVLPVVAMVEASATQSHLKLPYDLQRTGYRSAGTREKRKGKGARRRSEDKVAPKERLVLKRWQLVEHEAPVGACYHELWALDGTVVSVLPGAEPTLDATHVACTHIEWRHDDDGFHPIGSLLVPCPQGSFLVDIDYAADRLDAKGKKSSLSLADVIRPLPEILAESNRIEGFRSDVESVFSWLKALLPRNRAGSLTASNFFLDAIGAGLLCNAIAWDVHAAQHTRCAQHEARLDRRGQREKTVTR